MVGKLQLKLKRRPTLETLSRNGYYKNEPCFGNYLNHTVMHEVHIDVPKVLVESIRVLESNPLYMKSLGLYRISGSHTVIQKLRFKINSNNYKLLWEQTDPNNITGLIKLFFRELQHPLISLDQIKDAIPKEEYSYFAGLYKLQ
ncbi:WW domain-containing protein tag-325 [Pseudolycoriella hygida]|uniref:WW domain-containing protein tag-325 n=1 Tax=Pseudolycoriella hygida TaxID=35572 RepID=A0A9Q0MPX5_9DIPT|nr:WW domain-containing protein tag-325 [Pseudolycoriella hygida]